MNPTLPDTELQGPSTPEEMSFYSLPAEVKARLLAQHCVRLLADNDRLALENKYLLNTNQDLRVRLDYKTETVDSLKRDKDKLEKDLQLYRKFVRSNSVQGIFNHYCRTNKTNGAIKSIP